MLLPYFEWVNNLPASKFINESLWLFAVIQAFHLVALALLSGSLLVVDLRLLGRGFASRTVAQVARDAWPWLIGGIVGMVATGIPQLMANASRVYYSEYFWQKMYLLAAALVFTFTVRRMVTAADEARVSRIGAKVVALVSLALWSGVAMSGRLIGLFT
jgi:hypothetical protein